MFIENLVKHFDENSNLNEIILNGMQSTIFVDDISSIAKASYSNDQTKLIRLIQDFAFSQGLRLDPNSPSNGGTWRKNQYRWHAVIPPMAFNGPIFSLRKHRFDKLNLDSYEWQQNTQQQLINLVEKRENIIFCGETGSGKTSLLTNILQQFCKEDRVIILETLNEIPCLSLMWSKFIEHKINVSGHCEHKLNSYMEESLRLRPDRLVIGEIRSAEVLTFIEAISTGHSGVMTTIHGANLEQIISRLRLLLLKANIKENLANELIKSISETYIVFIARGSKPTIKSIAKIKKAL